MSLSWRVIGLSIFLILSPFAGLHSAQAEPGQHGATATSPITARLDSSEIRSTGEAECAKTLGLRNGAWVCPDAVTVRGRATRSADTNLTASGAPFCQASTACWDQVTDYEETNYVSAVYGVGSTTLGKVTLRNRDTYSGASLKSTFSLDTDRALTSVTFVAQRLNTAISANGTPVTPRQTYSYGSVAKGGTALKSSWAILYDNSAGEQSLWHEADWKVSGVTSTFYVFQKSLEAYKNSAGGYTYYQYAVPSAAYGSGAS